MAAGGRWVCRMTLPRWHWRHCRAHCVTSFARRVHTKRDEINRLEALPPGWPALWSWSNTCRRCWTGTKGRKLPVEVSPYSWCAPAGCEVTCIEVDDFNTATSGQAACAAAMFSKDTGGVAAASSSGGDVAEQAPGVAGQSPDVAEGCDGGVGCGGAKGLERASATTFSTPAEGRGVGGGGAKGLERASATTFSTPGVCWMSVENSDM